MKTLGSELTGFFTSGQNRLEVRSLLRYLALLAAVVAALRPGDLLPQAQPEHDHRQPDPSPE